MFSLKIVTSQREFLRKAVRTLSKHHVFIDKITYEKDREREGNREKVRERDGRERKREISTSWWHQIT